MRKRLHKTTLLFMIAIGVISMDACRKNYDATAEDMTEYGWVLYTAGDYLSSNEWFKSSIVENDKWKDGYNGLGWSYAKLMVMDTSITHFITGLATEEDKWLTTDVQSEILAGLVFSYHAKGIDTSVLAYGRAFIDSTAKPLTPGWMFSHDSLINHLDVRITLAASYFAVGKFDSASLQVQIVLDSLNSSVIAISDTSLEGRRKMAEQISSLQTSLLKQ